MVAISPAPWLSADSAERAGIAAGQITFENAPHRGARWAPESAARQACGPPVRRRAVRAQAALRTGNLRPPARFEETDKRDGQVQGTAKMTVSPDGRTMTMVFRDHQRGTSTFCVCQAVAGPGGTSHSAIRYCVRFTHRYNEVMRKRVLGSTLLPSDAADGHEWLKLQDLAEGEVTSEADGYPVETAFNFGVGPGWRAASPGIQRIRLVFDQPQSIQRMRLQFNEPDVVRTQEFTVGWSGRPDEPLKEVVRQQWNFSPDGSAAESEDYAIDLKGVSILELTIDPDRGAGEALAKLAEWRLA